MLNFIQLNYIPILIVLGLILLGLIILLLPKKKKTDRPKSVTTDEMLEKTTKEVIQDYKTKNEDLYKEIDRLKKVNADLIKNETALLMELSKYKSPPTLDQSAEPLKMPEAVKIDLHEKSMQITIKEWGNWLQITTGGGFKTEINPYLGENLILAILQALDAEGFGVYYKTNTLSSISKPEPQKVNGKKARK